MDLDILFGPFGLKLFIFYISFGFQIFWLRASLKRYVLSKWASGATKLIVISIFTLAITIGVSNSISTNGTCVCAHSRQPVLSAPSNFAHIETYIEAGYCLQSALPVQDPWISVLYDRHLALETFSAVGMVRTTNDVFVKTVCPPNYPGHIHCDTGPCVNGYCHSSNFDSGKPHWCICDPGYTGQECDTKHVCTRSKISVAGKCYDLINHDLVHHNLSHVAEYNFAGSIYPLNEDCIVSTSSNPLVRGVYCYCGQTRALLYSNHSLSMCGCQGGQMRKLDGTCTDMSLCILSDYCVHGSCLNTTLIPTCVCESGYTGLRCDTKTVHIVKYCNGKLCNHGVCVGTFCLCDMGWEGELCDTLQQCQNGYSTFSHCFPYDTDVTFDVCPIDTIRNCHTCYLYPFTKSGVICEINLEGENVRLKLIDGSFVERINKDHDEKLGGCFPPDSLVIGVNNKTIKMKSLRVGETILTVDAHGRYKYTKVILMFHNDSKGKLKYRKIVTENGHSIEISLEHLIYTAKRRNDKTEVKAAGKIKEGDFIHVFDKYRGYTKAVRVIHISEEVKTGLYAPLTETGNLIVDDHLVSSYATYEDQDIVHLIFLPWRLAFKFNAWMWDQEPYAPMESGAHWSLKGFFMFANLRCYLFNEEYCEYMNF